MRKVILNMTEQEKYEIIKSLVDHNGNKDRAALKLGCTKRHVNRLIQKYKTVGKAAFIHGKKGRKPAHAFSDDMKNKINTLYNNKYWDATFSYACEILQQHDGILVHPENIGLFRSQNMKQGVKVTVLADDLECDVKIPGRLCVSLPGTEESEKTERYYVTDEIVRKTAEDTFEYFGNVNDRVLIHGGVVWLKQVENVLMQLPYVEEAKVIARNDASKKTELYVYFTSVEVPNPLDVASAMGKELSGYMVPAYIMQVAEFEKEESGVIHIMSLPVIEIKTVRRYCAPRNEQEVDLCEAFEAVLIVQHVGIEDNFYELGGDSLKR